MEKVIEPYVSGERSTLTKKFWSNLSKAPPKVGTLLRSITSSSGPGMGLAGQPTPTAPPAADPSLAASAALLAFEGAVAVMLAWIHVCASAQIASELPSQKVSGRAAEGRRQRLAPCHAGLPWGGRPRQRMSTKMARHEQTQHMPRIFSLASRWRCAFLASYSLSSKTPRMELSWRITPYFEDWSATKGDTSPCHAGFGGGTMLELDSSEALAPAPPPRKRTACC
mmetsp:Transcript_29686/g.79719  ORF Transcript_29686/g.79719 Transcript_29686/m.79719 type:complete len:225 (+) Transcript_29686:1331-2005(+)